MKLTNNQLTNSPVLSNVEGPINQYFFVLSCKSCQKTPLHLSRELYKSHLFLQNKANSPSVQDDTIAYSTRPYKILSNFFIPKNKAKQSQFKPNFGLKLGSFLIKLALFYDRIFAFANISVFFGVRLSAKLNAFTEFGGHIGFFPGEVWQVSAEMAAMSSIKINRPVKL